MSWRRRRLLCACPPDRRAPQPADEGQCLLSGMDFPDTLRLLDSSQQPANLGPRPHAQRVHDVVPGD